MSADICKGIGSVENLAKDCTAFLGTGSQRRTLHFNGRTALGFTICYHIACFPEKTVSTPQEPAEIIFLHPQAIRKSRSCVAADAPSGA